MNNIIEFEKQLFKELKINSADNFFLEYAFRFVQLNLDSGLRLADSFRKASEQLDKENNPSSSSAKFCLANAEMKLTNILIQSDIFAKYKDVFMDTYWNSIARIDRLGAILKMLELGDIRNSLEQEAVENSRVVKKVNKI